MLEKQNVLPAPEAGGKHILAELSFASHCFYAEQDLFARQLSIPLKQPLASAVRLSHALFDTYLKPKPYWQQRCLTNMSPNTSGDCLR